MPINMSAELLIEGIDPEVLTGEATPLVLWEMANEHDIENIACYLWRNGPRPPMAGLQTKRRIQLSEDSRPSKTYWQALKLEMHEFVCTENSSYDDLRNKLSALNDRSGYVIVATVSAYFGSQFGVHATYLSGLCAVLIYALAKLGKEAWCSYIRERLA